MGLRDERQASPGGGQVTFHSDFAPIRRSGARPGSSKPLARRVWVAGSIAAAGEIGLHFDGAPSTVLLTAAGFGGPLRLATCADAVSGELSYGASLPQF